MLLVIPSLTIKSGTCIGRIDFPPNGKLSPSYEKPEDRARLLRKENAKAIHLIFENEKEWDSEILEIIKKVREVVDIPIEISLSRVPEDISQVKQILQSGIYRLFLPPEASDYFVSHCVSDFTKQKIALSIPLEMADEKLFNRLKTEGVIRICITLANEDIFPIDELRRVAAKAKKLDLRLSLLFGVHSYKELMQLSSLEPGFDSVILGSALEENNFPCEGIWREVEARAFSSGKNEANLWKNPLQKVAG